MGRFFKNGLQIILDFFLCNGFQQKVEMCYYFKWNFWSKKAPFQPVQHKSFGYQMASECRSYDQPKIHRRPAYDQFALMDFRLVVRPTFGSHLVAKRFVLYGSLSQNAGHPCSLVSKKGNKIFSQILRNSFPPLFSVMLHSTAYQIVTFD